jgi:hypothetical protein
MLMVPGFGAVAFMSNAAGVALWAADIKITRARRADVEVGGSE